MTKVIYFGVFTVGLVFILTGCGAEPVSKAGGTGSSDPVAEQAFQNALGLYDSGDYDGAISALDRFIQEYGDSDRVDNATYLLGRSHYKLSEFSIAEETFSTMQQTYPNSILLDQAAYFLGRSQYKQGMYANAEQSFSRLVDSYPDSQYLDNGTYYLGKSKFLQDKFSDALANFLAVTKMNSSYADSAFYYAGRSEIELGKLEGPMSTHFSTADGYMEVLFSEYSNSPFMDNGTYRYGLSAYYAHNYTAAVTRFETLIAEYPDSIFLDNSVYFRAQSLYLGAQSSAELETALAALVQFKTDYSGSVFADNAALFQIMAQVDLSDCTGANDTLTRMRADFSGSSLIPTAESYMSANACTYIP